MNDNFIEMDFCKECEHYKSCSTSKYGISLLEKFMIFSALNEPEGDIENKFTTIFKNYNFTIDEVRLFVKNKKNQCIYFD